MVIRRTNKGKTIDIEALIAAQPSNSPAIGNMGVNAKGDRLGPNGEIIEKNEDRVRAYYRNNPKSSTSQASLKGEMPKLKPDAEAPPPYTPPQPAPTPSQPEEFDAPDNQEVVGFKEVEDENGNFTMVPIYKNE